MANVAWYGIDYVLGPHARINDGLMNLMVFDKTVGHLR